MICGVNDTSCKVHCAKAANGINRILSWKDADVSPNNPNVITSDDMSGLLARLYNADWTDKNDAADINEDGMVNADDYALLKQAMGCDIAGPGTQHDAQCDPDYCLLDVNSTYYMTPSHARCKPGAYGGPDAPVGCAQYCMGSDRTGAILKFTDANIDGDDTVDVSDFGALKKVYYKGARSSLRDGHERVNWAFDDAIDVSDYGKFLKGKVRCTDIQITQNKPYLCIVCDDDPATIPPDGPQDCCDNYPSTPQPSCNW